MRMWWWLWTCHTSLASNGLLLYNKSKVEVFFHSHQSHRDLVLGERRQSIVQQGPPQPRWGLLLSLLPSHDELSRPLRGYGSVPPPRPHLPGKRGSGCGRKRARWRTRVKASVTVALPLIVLRLLIKLLESVPKMLIIALCCVRGGNHASALMRVLQVQVCCLHASARGSTVTTAITWIWP